MNFKDDFWPLKTCRDVLRKQEVILASLMLVAFYNQRLGKIKNGLLGGTRLQSGTVFSSLPDSLLLSMLEGDICKSNKNC